MFNLSLLYFAMEESLDGKVVRRWSYYQCTIPMQRDLLMDDHIRVSYRICEMLLTLAHMDTYLPILSTSEERYLII